MAQRTHAIIGTGATSKRALFQSLEEVVKEGDAVSLVWAGPPNETVELAYDYVIDNDIEFTMFYEDGKMPPKVFRVSDVGVTQKSRNPLVAAAKSVTVGGKVLVLFDDDEQDDYFNAHDAIDGGVLFLDLSNGLAPIDFEGEDEEVETEEVEEEEVEEIETFTRDELLNMPAAAVKRYGVAKGAKAATKGGIIDELFPEMDVEEEEEDEPAPLKAGDKVPKPDLPSFPKNSNEEDQWVKLERSLTNVTPSKEAIVRIEAMRESFKGTGALILAFAPFGRERALAITKLEEAAMWAVKAIALEECRPSSLT